MTDYRTARGWLTAQERAALVRYANYNRMVLNNSVIVNIGIEYGASLHCLRAGSPSGTIVGVDIDPSKLEGNPNCEIIWGDSTDPETVGLVSEPIGLLFIDGGHSYENVLQDLIQWTPKVCNGAMLLLHDYSDLPMHADVVRAVQRWEQSVQWEFVEQIDTIRVYRHLGVL